jgi:glycosyltransferase involved in cell wall biosynthesis
MSARVMHVSQPGDGGVAAVVAQLARDQVERGLDVVVAGPPPAALKSAVLTAGARFLDWDAKRSPGPGSVLEARSLARVIAAEDPDLVHLHSSKAGLAGRLALRGRRPTLFQPHSWSFEALHGPMRRAATLWERHAAGWADAIVCVSETERRHGVDAGIDGRYVVVRNGVDLEAFAPPGAEGRGAARTRLQLADGPLAVCVGRLCRQKGQDVLLEAWPEVRARVPGARLVLVGDGPTEPELRAAAGEGVDLVGQRKDVPDWLTAADVVVAPSRWEGMALTLLEAMATGRSVVATDVAGAGEALGENAGRIVPIESVPELAQAVAERLHDPVLAANEGSAGRRRAEQSHDVRTTNDRIVALYGDVLGRALDRSGSAETAAVHPAP